jgi:hypothetical protein
VRKPFLGLQQIVRCEGAEQSTFLMFLYLYESQKRECLSLQYRLQILSSPLFLMWDILCRCVPDWKMRLNICESHSARIIAPYHIISFISFVYECDFFKNLTWWMCICSQFFIKEIIHNEENYEPIFSNKAQVPNMSSWLLAYNKSLGKESSWRMHLLSRRT